MRILMLNYEFPPLGGGAANATAHLLREFAAVPQLSIELVTSSTGSARVESFSENISIHFLDIHKRGSLHYQSYRDLLVYSWKAFRYARRLVRERTYDLCHAFFGIPCGHIARKLRVPYIVSLRGSDVPFFNERFRYLDRFLFRRMSRRIWRDARCVVANSKGLRELALTSAPSQKIEVIYNGVDTELFRPAPRRTDGLRVVCVSRLIKRKGIDYLIRAISELRGEDVSLVVAGTGNMERELRALARKTGVADRIHFSGFVPHDQTAKLYQESSVFCLPSNNEGMSLTVLEAMACGLPVLVTDVGGSAELLEDGRNGFLLQKQSPSDIAEKLRAYLENPGLLTEHGTRSRQIAETMSWHRTASAYKELYRRVATAY